MENPNLCTHFLTSHSTSSVFRLISVYPKATTSSALTLSTMEAELVRVQPAPYSWTKSRLRRGRFLKRQSLVSRWTRRSMSAQTRELQLRRTTSAKCLFHFQVHSKDLSWCSNR